MICKGDTIVFEPSLNSFHEVIMEGFASVLEVVANIPRLETELFQNWDGPVNPIVLYIDQNSVDLFKNKVF